MFIDYLINKLKFIIIRFKIMDRIIIAKISEGLGNQLFMYANAYTISRKFDLNLCLDPYSGYYKNNIRSFMLNNFNISSLPLNVSL